MSIDDCQMEEDPLLREVVRKEVPEVADNTEEALVAVVNKVILAVSGAMKERPKRKVRKQKELGRPAGPTAAEVEKNLRILEHVEKYGYKFDSEDIFLVAYDVAKAICDSPLQAISGEELAEFRAQVSDEARRKLIKEKLGKLSEEERGRLAGKGDTLLSEGERIKLAKGGRAQLTVNLREIGLVLRKTSVAGHPKGEFYRLQFSDDKDKWSPLKLLAIFEEETMK